MKERRPLLDVCDLSTRFHTDGGVVAAVDGVSFSIAPGETLALVGESGCGKSATAHSILRLISTPPGEIAGGRILLRHSADTDPIDLLEIPESQMRSVRGRRIAMVFQEPMSSLNPVYTVGEQIAEAVRLHQKVSRRAALAAAVESLARVGISAPDQRVRDYPHQLSGGMLQRVMIAMALSCRPSLLIADEPTTALDVTVQAQILELLTTIQRDTGMSILFITHDLGVVAQIAHRVCVMYAGRIVERANVSELFDHPAHPYTRGLLQSLPRLGPRRRRLDVIPGAVPNPLRFPEGCRFHPRCALSAERAAGGERAMCELNGGGDGGRKILTRCVRHVGDEPGGQPDLRRVAGDHDVACWEAQGYERADEAVDRA